MTVVGVGSVRGGPGVTSAALLLAGWLDDSVVTEADLDGGVIAVRYRLSREPGLTTLAAGHTVDPEDWRNHTQHAGGVPVLVGPDAPDRMRMLWSRAGRRLAPALAASSATIVVDGGRLRPDGATSELRAASALTLLLVRPVAEDLVGLAHRLPALDDRGALVLVGRGAYSSAHVGAEFGLDVLGTLPEDRRATAMLTAGGVSSRGLARTALARSMRTIADDVATRLDEEDKHGDKDRDEPGSEPDAARQSAAEAIS